MRGCTLTCLSQELEGVRVCRLSSESALSFCLGFGFKNSTGLHDMIGTPGKYKVVQPVCCTSRAVSAVLLIPMTL